MPVNTSWPIFVLSLVAVILAVPLARRFLLGPAWIDSPRDDRHHRAPVSRAGGICWTAGVVLGVLVGPVDRPEGILLLGVLASFALGLADDRGRVSPAAKWVLQTSLLLLVWIGFGWMDQAGAGAPGANGPGWRLELGWPAAAGLLFVLWVQTALEIFDNIDAALSLVAASTLAALALYLPADGLQRIALAGCGASVGFLVWNRPLARAFLGNAGSQAGSFLISVLLLCVLIPPRTGGERAAHPWAAALPLAWPVLDLGFVTVRRLRRGRPPWRGGRDHSTHELSRKLRSDALVAVAIALVAGSGLLLACWLHRGSR